MRYVQCVIGVVLWGVVGSGCASEGPNTNAGFEVTITTLPLPLHPIPANVGTTPGTTTSGATVPPPDPSTTTSAATPVVCGDGIVTGVEQCDCAGAEWCDGGACLGGMAPNGTLYHGGSKVCNGATCTLTDAQCEWCGDGVRNGTGAETCDGADIGGVTCTALGFSGGTLHCSEVCTFDLSDCVLVLCGDGACVNPEDSCSCPEDCPDDPKMCSPCECGKIGGLCHCDETCLQYGDCCLNGPCQPPPGG